MPSLGMTGGSFRLVRQQVSLQIGPLSPSSQTLLHNETADVIVTELGDAIATEAN